jgi:hypothetical protein
VIRDRVRDSKETTPAWVGGFLYIIASKYAKETNKKLFDEDFTVYTRGPVIPAVAALFHRGSISKKQLKHLEQILPMLDVDDAVLTHIYNRMYNKVKQYTGVTIMGQLRGAGSAWWATDANHKHIIPWKLILHDTSYSQLIQKEQ